MLPRVLGTVCQVGQDETLLALDGVLLTFNGEREGDAAGRRGGMGK